MGKSLPIDKMSSSYTPHLLRRPKDISVVNSQHLRSAFHDKASTQILEKEICIEIGEVDVY